MAISSLKPILGEVSGGTEGRLVAGPWAAKFPVVVTTAVAWVSEWAVVWRAAPAAEVVAAWGQTAMKEVLVTLVPDLLFKMLQCRRSLSACA